MAYRILQVANYRSQIVYYFKNDERYATGDGRQAIS